MTPLEVFTYAFLFLLVTIIIVCTTVMVVCINNHYKKKADDAFYLPSDVKQKIDNL
ncbi:hypothetical protein [Tenacibaculum litopenaei]|uniref:hypothetical protein n=1 Tax=Tenacibaculum litopenaei TaxID=396016 RepID=UPI0038B43275